jgi:hypothetical protein
MPNTKSELWWSAFTAALSGSRLFDDADIHIEQATLFADSSLKAFAKRWPDIWARLEE